MQRIRTLAVWLLVCLAGSVALHSDSLTGYTRRVWQAPDGLPEQTVQAFAQTPDGYLWIGTTGGLLRFDGAHFTVFDQNNTPALHENSIFCLLVSSDGALWIGTEGGGLARYLYGQFRSWTSKDGLSNDFVRALAQDANGTIWAGTDLGLLRVEGERLVRVDNTGTIPSLSVHSIYGDRAGRLWVGGWMLYELRGKTAIPYPLGKETGDNQIKSILQTQDGTLWVGTVSGLNRMVPGSLSFEKVKGITGTVRVLRQTPDGVLWIGTIGRGAFEYSDGKLTQLTSPTVLPSNTVLNFFEDNEENFWIGTQAGMLRLTRTPVSLIALPQANDSDFGTLGRDSDGSLWSASTQLFRIHNGVVAPLVLPEMEGAHVRNLFRDRSGELWVGTDGSGIFRIADGKTQRFTSGLSNPFIRAITQDRDQSIWAATDGGLSHLLGEGAKRRIVGYQQWDGLAYASTRALLEDSHGDLWVGTDRGVSHLHNGAFVSDAATKAMAQMKIWTIHEDADGGLWFGSRNNGLFRYRDGKMAHFSAEDGLVGNAIYQILEDRVGHLWTSGPNGISLLDRHQLDAQANTFPRHLALTFYSISEMEGNTEIYGGTQPSGYIAPEGDVWFPSNRGLIHVQPLQSAPLPPPPIRILSVIADGHPSSILAPIQLQPRNSRLEFAFAPIRMRSQVGLRFHYRLDGFDHDWSPPIAARTADYTNLPPGHYRFRVQAFDVGNPESVTESTIEVIQLPHFFRTWWFITASFALLALLVSGAYRYRVHQMKSRYEAVLEERSRLAREMHDTVIQGCTGVSALMEALSMKTSGDKVDTGLLDFARTQLRNTINEAREAIWNLRHSGDNSDDIGQRIAEMTQHAGKEFNIPVSYTLTGTPFGLSHPVAHDLLMVAREAVFNAVLHGSPTQVEVTLTYDRKELVLCVRDDGCGFDAQTIEQQEGNHFGLKGMRERIERSRGKFQLVTWLGKGVFIEVHLAASR